MIRMPHGHEINSHIYNDHDSQIEKNLVYRLPYVLQAK